MAGLEFYPGQRWVSNTESELGLGRILSFSNRRVEIEFPAAQETRTYAVDNAPLSRIRFSEGEVVEDELGDLFVVLSSVEHQNCLIYQCADDSGKEIILPEQHLGSAVHFIKPQQRLFAGQIDRQGFFKLRVKTLNQLNRLNRSEVRGLLGARVDLLPHQLHIAHRLGQAEQPRALLADEVGLGKTIEAGLIILQRIITGRTARVLLCLPENLQHQWLVEMLRRFNLPFSLFDEERIESLLESGEGNPFETSQKVICSIPLLTHSDEYLELALAAGWDLLVVDEAHHLGWSEAQPSHAYTVVEQLCREIPSVLLLTATPENLGPEGHFARLKLLDPNRFSDLSDYLTERTAYKSLSAQLLEIEALGAEGLKKDVALLEKLQVQLGEDKVSEFTAAQDNETAELLFRRLVDLLVSTRGPGRMMFRNTRENLVGFPKRSVTAYWLEKPEPYDARACELSVHDQLMPETVIGEGWISQDERVRWLEKWLLEHKKRKALLICANAQTAIELENHLNLRMGVRSAAFHEEMSLINRDRAAAYFADPEQGAQILICSEIGSEGRNFQFASDLILFDLPPNPDLLEQRIGRLDRIGQHADISIHYPGYADTVGARLFQWLNQGLNAFESVSVVGDAVFREFGTELLERLKENDIPALEALIERTRLRRLALEDEMAKGRDRLLELNSQPNEQDAELVDLMLEAESVDALKGYAEHLFDRFGLEMQPHGPNGWVIRPGDEMLAPLTTLSDEGMTLTFDRQEALQREDIHYLSWEHPLMIELMEWVASSEFGNTALCTLTLPPLPAGTVLVEMHYRASLSAPRAWQLDRYIDQPVIRYLIDPTGRDLGALLGHEPLNQLAKTLSLGASQKMIRMLREQLETQIKIIDSLADKALPELKASSKARYLDVLERRISELQVLASRGSVDAKTELERLSEQSSKHLDALARIELVPDSVRIIVTGE